MRTAGAVSVAHTDIVAAGTIFGVYGGHACPNANIKCAQGSSCCTPLISRCPIQLWQCVCAGLLQKKSQDGLQTTMEATLMAQQTPAQREQVRQLQPGAVASWWQPGHPGWAIYPVDSEQFMSTGALENVNVTNEQIVAPLPMGCEFPPHASVWLTLWSRAQLHNTILDAGVKTQESMQN